MDNEDDKDSYNAIIDENKHPEESNHIDDKSAYLEKQNERLRDTIKEMFFYFILVAIIAIDIVSFMFMENWAAPITIGIIEFIAIFIIAKKCNIDIVEEIYNGFLDTFNNIRSNKNKD